MIPLASMPCTTFCFVCFYQTAFCRVCVFILWTFVSAHKQINELISCLSLPYCRQWVLLPPWLKSLDMPLNTRDTGAAQRSLIKALSHKSFWKSRFHEPFCFHWKAITREHHAPKFCHAKHTKIRPMHDILSTAATVSSLSYYQCCHIWCFERNFWCLMFWRQIWCWAGCCCFPQFFSF